MRRMDKDNEFKYYLNEVCTEYKRKKNFIKMIDAYDLFTEDRF